MGAAPDAAAALRLIQQSAGQDQGATAAAVLAATYPAGGERSPAYSAQWPFCARLTPHVRALWLSGAAPKIAAMGFLLNQSAIYLDGIADYPGALVLAEAWFDLARARLPPEHLAATLNNLSAERNLQGPGAAAARLFVISLRILRAVLPSGDARIAYGALNTGAAWLQSGAAGTAEPLLREALEIREAVFAAQPQHPDRRAAAQWLIACLLVRAGQNRRGASDGGAALV